MSSQRKELFTERRAKQAELRLLQRKVDMAELVIKYCILIKIYNLHDYIILFICDMVLMCEFLGCNASPIQSEFKLHTVLDI